MLEKNKSRKWTLTKWAMVLITILIIMAFILSMFDKNVMWIAGIASVLALVPTAYMGANALSKKRKGYEK